MDVPMPKPYKTRGTHFKWSFYREQLIAFKEKTKRRRHSSESVPTSFAAHVHFLLELFCQNTKSKFSSPHCRHTVGPNGKNPPKIDYKILEKLTDPTYACNSLTIFLIWSARNDRKGKLCESCLEKFVKPQQVNLFSADFWNSHRRHVSSLRFGG